MQEHRLAGVRDNGLMSEVTIKSLTDGPLEVSGEVEILAAEFEPDEFLAQLESEHRVKPGVRERRGIGFTPGP